MINKSKTNINELNERLVKFHFVIDGAEPETVDIKITRKRWEILGQPTYLTLTVENPNDEAKNVEALT